MRNIIKNGEKSMTGGTNMKRSMTLEEAIKSGYRCTCPDRSPKGLSNLCNILGPDYHLAAFDELPGVGKDIVIQRVIGDGYDVEIYHNGKFNVVLWAGYGNHTVDEVKNVPAGEVERCVREMVSAHCNQ